MATSETKHRVLNAAALNDINLDELITAVRDLLPQIAPAQSRYTVAEIPDNRTIRYYISQNLLPKPLSYAGGRANYGGTHVLTLLFIKQQQALHFSLRQIKQQLDALAAQYQLGSQDYQRYLIDLLLVGNATMQAPMLADLAIENAPRQRLLKRAVAPVVSNKPLPSRLAAGIKVKPSESQAPSITGNNIVEYRIHAECAVYVSAAPTRQRESAREIAQALRQLADQLQDEAEH